MKIVIVATHGPSLWNFRGNLIKEWVSGGHEVTCISVEPEEEMNERIHALGANYYRVDGKRTSTSIVGGLKMIWGYKKAFKKLRPDLCFLYMSKPIAFGGLAAIWCKVKRIVVFVTGLEVAFYSKGVKDTLVRSILKLLYKKIFKVCETVFFMCKTDLKKMIDWKLVKEEQTAYVDGSGVDMTWFTKKPMPKEPVVAMTARLLWSKGVREYAQAAAIVRKKHPEVPFLLIGGVDENPESLTEKELDELIRNGAIEYCGFKDDVRPYLERCSIFVLPSYHEGKGKSILEAQAVGRPIITTTAPGCSETVIDGYNGFLVPIKDAEALAEKICTLVEDAQLRNKMAENAYDFCSRTFDVNIINYAFLTRMGMK